MIIVVFVAKKYGELARQNQVPQTQAQPKNLSSQPQPSGNAEGEKAKKEKKAAKPAKVEKKEEAAAPAGGEEDEVDEAYADEPKQKDPFADMPKSSFNTDEFKRVYSNEDTAEKAIPYFWQNFDNEHMSIWFLRVQIPRRVNSSLQDLQFSLRIFSTFG